MNEDRIWEMYFSDAYQEGTREAARDRIGWFLEHAHGHVLDVGCSQGVLPILLARAGHRVTGLDVEAEAIEFARARLAEEPAAVQARVELAVADARSWRAGASYDTVAMGEILEHLADPRSMVAAARGYLREGGRLLVTVPMGWLEHHDHRQEFLPDTLVALLEPDFGVDRLDVVDEKLRVVATAGGVSDPAVVAPERLAKLVASSLLALQHSHEQELARLRARLERHVTRVARLEARELQLASKVSTLDAQKKKLRESASYQLGSILVGTGMRPRTALQLPGRLAQLAVRELRRTRSGGGIGVPSASDVYDGKFRVSMPGARTFADAVDGRILHLLEYSLPHQNGYTLRSFHIVQAQKQRGWDPVVITKPGFPEGVREAGPETIAGVPHYRLTSKQLGNDADLPRYITSFASEAAAIVEKVKPSIVQAGSNFRNAYPALELARHYRLPFVYEVRGLWEETRVANGTLDRGDAKFDRLVGVEAYCAKNADAVVTLGTNLKEELVQRGVPAEKIFLVPNAVDAPLTLPERREDLARRLELSGRFVVSYIGSVSKLESLHMLVEAIARLKPQRRDIAALVVGDGSALEELRHLAEQRGVADLVRFVGSVPHVEVRDYYGITDVVACTRGHDRVCSVVTPLKPYEAMAYAKPVIVSDIPALREMVIDRVNGRLVRAEDPDALARVLAELADDPEGRRALGARAAAWVREHRSWSRVVEGYAPAYAYAREAFARRQEIPR